jgi:uncharacterized membrane protein
VAEIVASRCSMCHAAEPVWAGIGDAPKGVRLDDSHQIRRYAPLIDVNAVRSNAMPPGNVTEMTEDERAALAGWIAGNQGGRSPNAR